jgi:Tfp pilus assembly protein PilO
MRRENFYSIVFILISVLLVFFFISPKREIVSQLNSEIKQKEIGLQNQDKYFQKVREVYEKLKNYQEEISKIDSALPKDPSIPSLFDFLQRTSSQSGLLLENLALSGMKEEGKIKKWTINLSLKGDYTSFKNFISTIEKSARLIKVEKILISSEGELLSFSLAISVFSY